MNDPGAGHRHRVRFLERLRQESPLVYRGARCVERPDGVLLEAALPPDVRPRRVRYLADRARALWAEVSGDQASGGGASSPRLRAVRFMAAVGDETDELVRASEAGLEWNPDGLVHSVHWMWGDPDAQDHYDSFEWALERLSRFDELVDSCPEAAREAVGRVLRGDDTMHRADVAAFLVRFSRHREAFAEHLRAALAWRLEADGLDPRLRQHYQECLDRLDGPDGPSAPSAG